MSKEYKGYLQHIQKVPEHEISIMKTNMNFQSKRAC